MDVLQAQLDDVELQLRTAEIIETGTPSGKVEIGSRVSVELDGEEETYFIGSEADSDPARGVISHRSPIGAALIGKAVGEEVEASTPFGATLRLRVLGIGE
ncbi:MAG TPA: GreA/GreB family elongation factor [Terriglobales bacterium]|nr:GreA/GreB family elongation factor [Terriglobales bacterium]